MLKDHLEDTAILASIFAKKFNAGKFGYLAGLFHDIGKYSLPFQRILEGERLKVDHSTAGAKEALSLHPAFGILIAYIIAGHHCGLIDWGSRASESSLEGRMYKTLLDYSVYRSEISLPNINEMHFPFIKFPSGQGFTAQFFIRMLFSALVDSDFLDTERALNNKKSLIRGCNVVPVNLLPSLESKLTTMSTKVPATRVNRWRTEILESCIRKASERRGMFTLTVPTGGGKTLSSMAFALNHAAIHGMERVIYVIPYVSIIEQNAEVFRNIFGRDMVLEHHSTYTYSDDTESALEYSGIASEKLKLAAENWDMPIVVTTNVQFFESLFAARSSSCRKLHNIANSVIVIDEAQMIPTGFLKPCINAITELAVNYNTSIVLCTATQPAITKFLPYEVQPLEIMDSPEELYTNFQRVQVQHLGDLSDEVLAGRLLRHKQVLCIVNSKKHARILFEKTQTVGTYHLSTRMCPAHRSQTLKTIKELLKGGEVCRLVSTQLVEAGVDIDFPYVYRSSAGLDSIAQSAGRCNREGLLEKGLLFVFRPEKHGLPAGWLGRTASIGEGIFRKRTDPLDLESIADYFSQLYDIEGEELDRKRIMENIKEQERQLRFPFRSIADKFKLIDENTTSLIIPWDDSCKQFLEQLRISNNPKMLLRKLQKYTVQVFEQELGEMLCFGAIEVIHGKFYVLLEESYGERYSEEVGLLPFTDSMFLKDMLIV